MGNNPNIGGTIPTSLTTLPNLKDLRLELMGLTGEIIPELGDLTTLERLDLNHNNFTGNIPNSVYSLPSLKTFKVKRNTNLTGALL